MSKGTLFVPSRRRILHFGMAGVGTSFLAGCAGMGGLAGNLMGGGGEKVDWTTLGNEFTANLAKIADQTDNLLKVQELYASTLGLKDKAADLRALAKRMESGDPTGAAELDEQITLMTDTANEAVDEVRANAGKYSAAQKQRLAEGQKQHAQAIRNMWGGVVGIGMTLVKTTNAAPPSVSDIALFDTFKRITQVGPKALAFGETSEATYKEYAAAFEYIGVATTPDLGLETIPTMSM